MYINTNFFTNLIIGYLKTLAKLHKYFGDKPYLFFKLIIFNCILAEIKDNLACVGVSLAVLV